MSEAEQFHSQVITHSTTGRPEVALTFDDGPYTPFTLHVLDTLRFYKIQATFFCLGRNVEHLPTVVERMQKEGHLVENHGWSHRALTEITDAQEISMELARCTEVITSIAGTRPTFFRPPYGQYNAQVLSCAQAQHLTPVLWTIDSRDWAQSGADAIYQNCINQMKNGAILLLHDGEGDRTATIEALPRIIEWVRQHQLRPVTLHQLLS